jgi:hydroxymethylpyrimidine pyrophosphatase-like HAD family hydrolase
MNDPYLSTARCVIRLLSAYREHPRLIVAVDFDDTVFDFHNHGYKFPKAIELIKRAQAAGFYIVGFTASKPERYPFIQEHFESLGIKLDAINTNVIPSAYGNSGKIFYNILLDDRAGLEQAMDILSRTLNIIKTSNIQYDI